MKHLGIVLLTCSLGGQFPLRAEEKPKAVADAAAQTVEALAESARKSIVVVTVAGRDGKQAGLGTGFVVGDGLIATNLHVIGEARPISVELADGKKHEVTAVHATDRTADLWDALLPAVRDVGGGRSRRGRAVGASRGGGRRCGGVGRAAPGWWGGGRRRPRRGGSRRRGG